MVQVFVDGFFKERKFWLFPEALNNYQNSCFLNGETVFLHPPEQQGGNLWAGQFFNTFIITLERCRSGNGADC